jgi:hypothetical protein
MPDRHGHLLRPRCPSSATAPSARPAGGTSATRSASRATRPATERTAATPFASLPHYQTCYRTVCCQVRKPCYQTCYRNVTYTVCKPCYQTCYRTVCYTVRKPCTTRPATAMSAAPVTGLRDRDTDLPRTSATPPAVRSPKPGARTSAVRRVADRQGMRQRSCRDLPEQLVDLLLWNDSSAWSFPLASATAAMNTSRTATAVLLPTATADAMVLPDAENGDPGCSVPQRDAARRSGCPKNGTPVRSDLHPLGHGNQALPRCLAPRCCRRCALHLHEAGALHDLQLDLRAPAPSRFPTPPAPTLVSAGPSRCPTPPAPGPVRTVSQVRCRTRPAAGHLRAAHRSRSRTPPAR